MGKLTQCQMILNHMQTKGAITPIDALTLYGCMRLAARIADLRREGYEIETEIRETPTSRYAAYKLSTEPARGTQSV